MQSHCFTDIVLLRVVNSRDVLVDVFMAIHNDKMSIFEVDCTRVALAGVILSGHLTLHNPH